MRFTSMVLGCLLSFYVYADNNVYKCVDSNGKKNYQSHPCAEGVTNSTLNIKTGSSTNLDEEQKKQELKQQEEQAKLESENLSKQQLKEKQEAVNKEAKTVSDETQKMIKENPKKFSPGAVLPYTPDKLSALVKKHQERLADIERLRRTVAEKALNSGECERVEASELDDKSTQESLVFSVNCSTGKSFSFTEQDLKK
jgi:hypothetical protein